MVALTIEFREYSTQGRCRLQEAGFEGSDTSQSLIGPLQPARWSGDGTAEDRFTVGPNSLTEGSPNPRRELGTTVGDDVLGDTMQLDHLGCEEVRRFGRRQEFGGGQ